MLRRSGLPPREEMSMHVDHDEFMSIINRDDEFRELANKLAPVIHEEYRAVALPDATYNVPFENLPEHIKQDNVAAADRIAPVLNLIGMKVVRASTPDEDAFGLTQQLIQTNLELLAEEEHDGWMEQKQLDGWKYAEQSDDAGKRHPSLRPYYELSEVDKNKDRNSVLNYPQLLRAYGYKTVRIVPKSWRMLD
jgi:hypothetical protein